MKKQLLSFFYAIRGVGDAIIDETHLRFHLVAAFYVLLFSPFFELSKTQYAVLILLIAAIISAELVNTAVEDVCDAMTRERKELIRLAKDIAAGAVLVLALGAVVVAVLFFWNAEGWLNAVRFFRAYPLLLLPLGISAVGAVLFVWMPWLKKK